MGHLCVCQKTSLIISNPSLLKTVELLASSVVISSGWTTSEVDGVTSSDSVSLSADYIEIITWENLPMHSWVMA